MPNEKAVDDLGTAFGDVASECGLAFALKRRLSATV
jgi:hypothetical protein